MIHPTALVEGGVEIGAGTAVWDSAHLRGPGTRVGGDCIIGEKTYLAPGVVLGDRVKVNAFVYICSGVTVGDGVMIAAGVTFTNDRFPRATTPDLRTLRPSEPDDHTLSTIVAEGATLGARATIGCDLTIGRFAMVGMGAVITRSVPDFGLVFGNPGRLEGWVCRCGEPVWRRGDDPIAASTPLVCAGCSRRYGLDGTQLTEARPDPAG